MPRKDDEESNYFNHFGLAPDKKKKEKDFRKTLPPKPPEKTKEEKEKEAKAAAEKGKEAKAAEQRKKVLQQKTNSSIVDETKSRNTTGEDPTKNKENETKNDAPIKQEKKSPVAITPANTKEKDMKFVSWVTNGKDDDLHECENVLF